MDIREIIEQDISCWSQLGHPAILQKFILHMGREFAPGPRQGKRMKRKECFKNATQVAMWSHDYEYVEGYVISERLPLLIHHAWVSRDGKTVMDPTLDDCEDYQYFGVPFPANELLDWTTQLGSYGLLDTGMGLNAKLIFEKMPSLRPPKKSLVSDDNRR